MAKWHKISYKKQNIFNYLDEREREGVTVRWRSEDQQHFFLSASSSSFSSTLMLPLMET